ncbi:hypothetical protein GCM10007385_10520 [Tateyamaria omphalii]|nr:hypothetical protein GCM10007385_10520 [Tateyamaria omphalii]
MLSPDARRHGYALIVVLGALVILTFLASLSSKTLLSEHHSSVATREFQDRQALSADGVSYVMDLARGARTPARLALPGHDDVWVDLVDVGGLIDLKTARSALSAKVMAHLDLTQDQTRRYRNWQRNPGQEADLSAFLRAIGGTPDQLVPLSRVATLRSGRPGISPMHAPRAVLELVTEADGSREVLMSRVPPAFVSQPRRTLRQVWITRGDVQWLAGEVRVSDGSGAAWLWAP